MSERPRAAVLATHWSNGTEGGWFTRQVAGALAHGADVHVITPDGSSPGVSADGAFTLHRMATPVTPAMELRTELLSSALAAVPTGSRRTSSPDLTGLLRPELLDPWEDAVEVLDGLHPDLVLVVGLHTLGAVAALDRHDPELPMVLVALAEEREALGFPHVARVVDRASSVLVVTDAERTAVGAVRPDAPTRVVGAPLAANPSARTEPNAWVDGSEYVFVLTAASEDEDCTENDLARLLRVRFPDRTIAVSHRDAFCVWHGGEVRRGWPIERSSDLERLLAWADTTVDLRPGGLFARTCITSMLHGTPIIVPSGSRAEQHARRGSGGLWFRGAAELARCVDAMCSPSVRDPLGRQGRNYAEREFGHTGAFVERVLTACALLDPEPVCG